MSLPKYDIIHNEKDLINAGYITNELKPCPFCGCKTILTAGSKNETTGYVGYKAFCTETIKCGASVHCCLGGIETIDEARETVVKKWNSRIY